MIENFRKVFHSRFKVFQIWSNKSFFKKKGKRNENCQLINIRLSKKDSCQRIQQEQDNNAMTHSVTWKTEFVCVSKFRFAKKYAKITPILVYIEIFVSLQRLELVMFNLFLISTKLFEGCYWIIHVRWHIAPFCCSWIFIQIATKFETGNITIYFRSCKYVFRETTKIAKWRCLLFVRGRQSQQRCYSNLLRDINMVYIIQ